jgi:D-sedoheptulose 7-phosphate isomerase
MDHKEAIKKIFSDSIDAQKRFVDDPSRVAAVADAVRAIVDCYKKGGKVLICGNGGSASDAQHMAAELVVRFEKERRSLPCIALSSDQASLTAIGNDYDFSQVFSRQIDAFARDGDVVIAISTSGNSPNILEAVKAAKQKKAVVIALGGRDGGKLAPLADIPVIVNAKNTGRIQEVHAIVIHAVCKLVEEAF